MRKIIKQGVMMKRMICETCGQIELISMEEMGICSNCGEKMSEIQDLTSKVFACEIEAGRKDEEEKVPEIPEPEKIIAEEPPLTLKKPAEQQEEISGPGPGKPVKKEDNRTCASCMHCAEKAGHGRGMQYKCGLSGAWFLTGLGCDAYKDK